jgi:hypothetical protein
VKWGNQKRTQPPIESTTRSLLNRECHFRKQKLKSYKKNEVTFVDCAVYQFLDKRPTQFGTERRFVAGVAKQENREIPIVR